MRTIEQLVAEMREGHFVYPPASTEGLERVRSLGLPEDVMRFYTLCDGGCLHETSPGGGWGEVDHRSWKWAVIPSEQLVYLPEVGYVSDDSPLISHQRHWVAVVDVMDGNYLAVSTEPGHVGEVIDCFHETLHEAGQNSIVARSFTEMLEALLSGPSCFWLKEDRPKYGTY